MLIYCFESAYIARTLAKCRKNDLAVVDTEGQTMVICPYFMEKKQMNYIPWIISFCSLIVAILSLMHTNNKDRTNEIKEDTEKFDSIEKSLLKANIKLDTVCSTTTETRADIKSLNTDLKNMDTRVVVLERDMKTAFNAIAELKGKLNHED